MRRVVRQAAIGSINGLMVPGHRVRSAGAGDVGGRPEGWVDGTDIPGTRRAFEVVQRRDAGRKEIERLGP
jgi:hypothetical protein